MTGTGPAREALVARTFVALADTLVTGFDIVDVLTELSTRCVELLAVSAAGLLLADPRDRLRVVASSDERTRVLELLEVQDDAGPCLECLRTGRVVSSADLRREPQRWPTFAAAAGAIGYRAVHAVPMRLRNETIGALNLFHTEPGALPAEDLHLAQAMADISTIGVLQHRALARSEQLAAQLQTALSSRLVIEQAKGVLAEREGSGMPGAFELMRAYARRTNSPLSAVAERVVLGELRGEQLRGPS